MNLSHNYSYWFREGISSNLDQWDPKGIFFRLLKKKFLCSSERSSGSNTQSLLECEKQSMWPWNSCSHLVILRGSDLKLNLILARAETRGRIWFLWHCRASKVCLPSGLPFTWTSNSSYSFKPVTDRNGTVMASEKEWSPFFFWQQRVKIQRNDRERWTFFC